jgi:hypothetical protein
MFILVFLFYSALSWAFVSVFVLFFSMIGAPIDVIWLIGIYLAYKCIDKTLANTIESYDHG